MRVTDFTREVMALRREDRRMKGQGYRRHETDWEIHRGGLFGKIIVDAQISADGLYVWTKIGDRPHA